MPLSAPAEPGTARLPVVPDKELDEQRGGFTWNGVGITLGAEIRTFLDGELVLQTNVSWTDAGATTTRFAAASLTPADAAQLQAGLLSTGGITMRVGDETVFLANQGQTALVHRTDGAFQNILLNTANGVEALQEVDATLDLQDFGSFQQDVLDTRLGQTIGESIGLSTISGLTQ